MHKITLALLATLALPTAALAGDGDNPGRDPQAAPQAAARVLPSVEFASSLHAAPAREAVEDLREHQLANPSR